LSFHFLFKSRVKKTQHFKLSDMKNMNFKQYETKANPPPLRSTPFFKVGCVPHFEKGGLGGIYAVASS
jgi:hypothetical protein